VDRRKDGQIHVTSFLAECEVPLLLVLTILPLSLGAAFRVTVLIEIIAFSTVAAGTRVLLFRDDGVMLRFLLWW
jgi:hypothetical protein